MWTWAYLLGGLIVWTVQFFTLYGASEIFQTSTTSRVITAFVTLVCLAVAAALTVRGWVGRAGPGDPTERWVHTIAAMGGATAFLAIAWQGLPALLI